MTKQKGNKADQKGKKHQWHADWELSNQQVEQYIYRQFPELSFMAVKKIGF
ncbi:hypothetical protein [Thalassobacillus pellis]|uniref:hypothetical protein n=1 Tax=Thalassobacillus pellis TaxID=748008 RepID=UPI0030840BB0|nr:hypothetical protein [Thalassobacillus pellis]